MSLSILNEVHIFFNYILYVCLIIFLFSFIVFVWLKTTDVKSNEEGGNRDGTNNGSEKIYLRNVVRDIQNSGVWRAVLVTLMIILALTFFYIVGLAF